MDIVTIAAGSAASPAPRAAYSVTETAELLGLCEASVYRALRRGDLVSVLIGGRRIIPASSIGKLLTLYAT